MSVEATFESRCPVCDEMIREANDLPGASDGLPELRVGRLRRHLSLLRRGLHGRVEAGQIDPDDYGSRSTEDLCEAHGHEPASPTAHRCYCGAVYYPPSIAHQLDHGLA